MMMLCLADSAEANFAIVDWGIIAAYLLLTTLIGARLAGKQSTIRDFFLAGRRMPWPAVCGSIIATEISAVTFIGVPAISFAAGGNLTYLQLGIGAILARVIIGLYLVPKYYRREIYSPYDYLGQQLGPPIKTLTTLLFFVGAVLGQGARVYVTAFVLSRIAQIDLSTSIWLIGIFSIGWTLIGGMTTVIWTDVIQFCVLVVGGILALGYAIGGVPDGIAGAIQHASEADKFRLFNLSTDLSEDYTLWCGLFAFSILNLAAFGLDQVMAQRMFCCKGPRQARSAMIWSSAGQIVALLMLCVGIALYAYFYYNPFTVSEAAAYKAHANYLLPIFIVRALPAGVRGLIVAAVFAAAISSLDSALAALSQTTVGAFKKPMAKAVARILRGRDLGVSDIGLSRIMVVGWGIILCLMATACIAISRQYSNVINLALGLTAYTYGPLLAILLMALMPRKRDAAGLLWAVPVAMLTVFGISVHVETLQVPGLDIGFNWADWVVWIGAAVMLGLALVKLKGDVRRVAAIVIAALAMVLLHGYQAGVGPFGEPRYLSFTWSFPIGAAVTFAIGQLLGHVTTAPGGAAKPGRSPQKAKGPGSRKRRRTSRRKSPQ
jgi:SSS family transporter